VDTDTRNFGITGTDPMVPFTMEVKKLTWETDDAYTLVLEHENEPGKPFDFKPGQFNMLYAFGVGESAISICSDSSRNQTISHTIHKIGYVTGALANLKKADVIGVRGPFGSSWPVEKAKGKDVVIVAGGIGLAPLRPALYYIFRNRKDYGKVTLLYGARTPRDMLFRVELEEWNRKYKIDIHVTVDRSDTFWKGNIGVVTHLFSYLELDKKNTLAMVCGPEVMMKFSIDELLLNGIEEQNIYLSMERNMKCAIAFCGHCQYGGDFICKDGPVFDFPHIKRFFDVREF